MKHMNKTILLVFLGILLLSGLSFAAVRFFAVNGTNGASANGTANGPESTGCQFDDGPDNDLYIQNHSTLQWAINNAFILMAATPGDTVDITVCYNDSNVLDGIDKYNGGIIVNASVFIHSAIQNVIIFNATDTSSTGYVFNVTAHFVNISTIMIRDATGGSGIFSNSSNHTFSSINISNCSKNINLWKSDNNNFTIMGSMNATAYNFFLNYSHNNSFTHVRVHNSTSIGIGVFASNNTFIFNNSVYWNLHSGIYMENANFTRIINCTFNNNSNSANNGGAINIFYDYSDTGATNITNNMFITNYRGIAISNTTRTVQIYNNTGYNDTVCSICLYEVNYSRIINNNVTNNSYYGVLLSLGTGGQGSMFNNITGVRTSLNTQYGIYVYYGANNTMTNVTSFSNTLDGFSVQTSTNNTINHSIASNNTRYGVYIYASTSNTMNNVTSYNNTLHGIVVDMSNSNTIISSNISNNVDIGIMVTMFSNSTNITSNSIYNNTRGFFVNQSTVAIFASNTINNNSNASIVLDNMASLTFSNNNNLFNSSQYEVYLTNGILSTGGYNISTAHLKFGLAAGTYNVSIQCINFSNVGSNGLNSVTSISGVSTFLAGYRVYNVHTNDYGLSVLPPGGTSYSIAPMLYYDSTNLSGPYTTSTMFISSTDAGGAWTKYSSTIDTGLTSISHSGMGAFGRYISPIVYVLSNVSTSSSGGTGSSKTYVKISSTSYDCKTKKLTVTLSENLNSGKLKLIDETSPYVATASAGISGGKAVFTISEASTYKIIEDTLPSTYSLDGYVLEEITSSEFACGAAAETPVTTTTACTSDSDCVSTEYCKADNTCGPVTGMCGYATNHAWIAYECCDNSDCGVVGETCKEHYCVAEGEQPPVPGTITKEMALTTISTADTAISTAIKAGKDTTEAKKKLNDANAELTKGDYAKAQLLAAEAEALAKSAKPKTEETTTTTTTTPETPATPPKPGFDLGLIGMVLGGLVIIVIAGVAVYFLTKKKSGPGSYKGTGR